jgi:hypothetical protein
VSDVQASAAVRYKHEVHKKAAQLMPVRGFYKARPPSHQASGGRRMR